MCGVVGIYGHPEAANLAYLGLYALQHRGQESAGIVASDGERLRFVREMGHVGDIFTAERLAQLRGFAAIGHVRYSTAGESRLANAWAYRDWVVRALKIADPGAVVWDEFVGQWIALAPLPFLSRAVGAMGYEGQTYPSTLAMHQMAKQRGEALGIDVDPLPIARD